MSVIHLLNLMFHDTIPYFVLINFVILIVLICLNWVYIKKFFLKINKKVWYALILIFFVSLLIRIFVPPHQHVMYIDEPWYMEAGKNMMQSGSQGEYPKSIGWPFILRISFGIFGVSNWVALYTSTVLGALTVFNIFFLAFMITKNEHVSLASSLVFSLFAAHIRWSASAETNVASLFFVTLTMFFCLLYYQDKKASLLWLSFVVLAFTSQFRPENYALSVLFLFGCFLFNKKVFRKSGLSFVLPLIVLVVLSFSDFVQVLEFYTSTNWIEQHTQGLETGENFGFSNLLFNIFAYGRYLFDATFQPWLFNLFFLLGLTYMAYKKKKEFLFLAGWFCCLMFVYSFSFPFIGGSKDFMAKTRFFMSFYPVMVIFMGYGMIWIKNLLSSLTESFFKKEYLVILLAGLIVILFIPYSAKAGSMFYSAAHKLETEIPELAEKDISHDCVIVANWPTVLKSTTDLNVVDLEKFLNEEEFRRSVLKGSDCVLFFEDIYCLDFEGFKNNCEMIKESYKLTDYKVYSEKEKRYTFYRISK